MSTAPGWDAGTTLADRFRSWAEDSPRIYPYAVRAMADDWEAGGPVREVLTGYEDAPKGAVVQLRLLAGVFRLVLSGRAEQLRPFYPCLGGTAEPAGIGPVLLEVIGDHVEELRTALRTAPQTNEVGRSAALLIGLVDLVAASGWGRIRLLEIGASAGLNLLIDSYRIEGAQWAYGPADAALRIREAVQGDVILEEFEIVARRGCDLQPIDPGTPAGRLMLTSFVWPDDVHRFERLEAALSTVDSVGAPPVDTAPASAWLGDQLSRDPEPEALTVVWNSITQQYWPPDEVTAVGRLLSDVGARRRLARISMEFRAGSGAGEYPELRTTLWSGDGSPPREQLLGHAHHHGIPVYLDA